MNYYWARNRKDQKQFKYSWDYGDHNEGDYWTKHHSTHYHRIMGTKYIRDKLNMMSSKLTTMSTLYENISKIASELQGCVDTGYHRQLR